MKIIKVDDEVHDKLSEIGSKSETYSEVIKRLIEVYYEYQKN